jgi:Ca-activated chloride channel family protein
MASCLRHLRERSLHLNHLMDFRIRPTLCAASVLLLSGFAPWSAVAQEKPDRPPWAQPGASTPSDANSAPVPTPQKSQEPPPARGTIRVNVNLVNVLVSVLDEHNRPVPDLLVDAFQILEQGVEQKIDVFESETTQPLDLALMIDSSMSNHQEMMTERDAASHFIQQVMRPEDRMAVYGFDENVTLMANFSGDVNVLQNGVRRITDGAGTSIYDAVVLGSQALAKRGSDRRRVIILVTDAGETTSRTDFESARRAALRSGVLLYTIVIRVVKNENGRNTGGEHALQTITDTTGGAMFFPDSARDLPAIFDRIDNELRTQYRLAYYPDPRGPANTYRTIEVKVQPGYTARHRTTYLTGPQ